MIPKFQPPTRILSHQRTSNEPSCVNIGPPVRLVREKRKKVSKRTVTVILRMHLATPIG